MTLFKRTEETEAVTRPPFIEERVWYHLTSEQRRRMDRLTEQASDVDLSTIRPVLDTDTWHQRIGGLVDKSITGQSLDGQDLSQALAREQEKWTREGGPHRITEEEAQEWVLSDYLDQWGRAIAQDRINRQLAAQGKKLITCPECPSDKARDARFCATCTPVLARMQADKDAAALMPDGRSRADHLTRYLV